MATYGWFLRHKRTGKPVRVDGNSVTIVDSLGEATSYKHETDAQNVKFTVLTLPMAKGIEYEVFDATIHEPPAPDADTTPVPTREDLLKAAHEAGASRRAAHNKARAHMREQPGGVLLPHPGFPKPKRTRKPRVKK